MLVRPALRAALIAAILALALPGSALAAPSNDDFSAALVGSGDQMEASGNNFGATKEPAEPDHDGDPGGASVWFGWTAPRSQSVFVQFCAEAWGARLGIYRGAAVDRLTPVASTHGVAGDYTCGEARFPVVAGLTYWFAVDGASGSGGADEGNFDFRISATPLNLPANDSFSSPTQLGSNSYAYLWGTTAEASREPGEPSPAGAPVGASVWFRWTAPETRAMRIFPCRAAFRPLISVYTGASLATLRSVGYPAATDVSLPSECQLGGLGGTGFDAVAGETYSFAVDSTDGSWGGFQLRLQTAIVPIVDVHPPNTYIYKLLRLRGKGIGIQFSSGGGPPGDTFRCRLDKEPFKPCTTPRKWRGLKPGMHRVAVVATDAAGNRDPSPATRTFRIGGR